MSRTVSRLWIIFLMQKGGPNEDMPSQKFIVEFIEEGDTTRLVTRNITDSSEQLEELLKMGMVEGYASQLNKLEVMLAS